jgi:hypothetical protein
MLLAISSLVSTAIAIVLGVVVWGWSNETPQEQVNRHFELIVRELNN